MLTLLFLERPTSPDPALVAQFMKRPASVYTDIDFVRDADGVYDLAIDTETSDMALIDSLDSAVMVSLFSDRRAAADEVVDPLKRRGWIGDLLSDRPDDRHGNGWWLYEQAKLISRTVIGLKNEAERALRWMTEDGLTTTIRAVVTPNPAERSVAVSISAQSAAGGVWTRVFVLTDNTARRSITNQST